MSPPWTHSPDSEPNSLCPFSINAACLATYTFFFTSENVDEKKNKEDPDLSEKVIEIAETNEDKSQCKFCAKCFQLHVWQNLAYICQILNVAVSFIGGGNWSTRRKQSTCRKSLTNL
jgi:hypothetical protein